MAPKLNPLMERSLKMRGLWLAGWLLSLSMSAVVQAAYVTEKLEVPVRAGESQEFRILRYLVAGSEVTVLETLPSGYARIKDSRDREGFILARYLVETPPAFARAGRLEAELAKRDATITRLERELTANQDNLGRSQAEVVRLSERLQTLESELEGLASGDITTLRNRLVGLETERQMLLADNETLRAEKLAASDDSAKTWFGLGALTLALGWFAGFLMPRIRRHQVSNQL
jgi:SH3 domain protein